MAKNKVLYSITTEDVRNVAEELGYTFSDKDIDAIEEHIVELMGNAWYTSIEAALEKLYGSLAKDKLDDYEKED